MQMLYNCSSLTLEIHNIANNITVTNFIILSSVMKCSDTFMKTHNVATTKKNITNRNTMLFTSDKHGFTVKRCISDVNSQCLTATST